MEELCRELGDRGRVIVVDGGKRPNVDLDRNSAEEESQLAVLLLNDAEGGRTTSLERCLASVMSTLQSIGRKKSKALMLRTDVLLDQLAEDNDTAAAWVSAEWSEDHVRVVAEAMKQVQTVQSGVSAGKATHIMSTVTALLNALEEVA